MNANRVKSKSNTINPHLHILYTLSTGGSKILPVGEEGWVARITNNTKSYNNNRHKNHIYTGCDCLEVEVVS